MPSPKALKKEREGKGVRQRVNAWLNVKASGAHLGQKRLSLSEPRYFSLVLRPW